MSRRGGLVGLAASIAVAYVCAGLIAWRLTPPRHEPAPPAPAAPIPVVEGPEHGIRLSTIIDLPGDPVLVRRGAVLAPKDALISVPAKLGQEAPKTPAKAYFINSTLVSTTGGYMGKFQEAGQEAEALAAQVAMNSAQMAAAQNEPDYGSDDDGGADTPADAQSQFLTTANSNELEINLGGSRGQPQLKETILKPLVADTISNLLIANGYDADSARMIESAAKDSPAHVQTLPPQATAVAVGALDLAGEYRIKQLAIFENGEYVITIAAKDDGGYEQAAEPIIPAPLLDDSLRNQTIGTRFTIADGVYSAGIRNGMPDPVIRETIQLISRLADLRLPLQVDQTLRVLFEPEFRDKGKAGGKVVYVGLHGNALAIDCYSFEGGDGAFRCFDPKAGSEGGGESTPLPPSLGNSGATSVGGILAPIKGAPITSLFGLRFHPILHILRLHAGIDFGAPVGSPVRAAADGKVEIAGPVSGFGNHVRIQHAGFETSYSHLSEIPEGTHPGAEVKQGDIIALSGNTGLSTGPHLHFEFYLNREAVDPLPHLGSELQTAAASLKGPVTATAATPSPPALGATAGEIAAFPAIKAYLDQEIATLMN
ncbi:MAG: M23 family metallopeptidase [Hyphomicrobiales bacterium]|nr:M23 family metallopeptidase [Hyphomicrobiales bacterium]